MNEAFEGIFLAVPKLIWRADINQKDFCLMVFQTLDFLFSLTGKSHIKSRFLCDYPENSAVGPFAVRTHKVVNKYKSHSYGSLMDISEVSLMKINRRGFLIVKVP